MSTTIKPFGKPLTPEEETRLVECEAIVTAGLSSFVEVGTALGEINDRRLYRKTHSDFDSWLREKWNITARHAYRLIESAAVCEEVRPIGHIPPNEAQARELAKAPKGTRAAVLKEATRTAPGGKVTAKHIAETVSPKQEAIEVQPPKPLTVDAQWIAALGKTMPIESEIQALKTLEDFMHYQDALFDRAKESLSTEDVAKFKLHAEIGLRKLRPQPV